MIAQVCNLRALYRSIIISIFTMPLNAEVYGGGSVADQFPHLTVYNYAENRVPGGIDLWGLQYVDANKSFYSIVSGQTWLHTNSFQSGKDVYGQSYIGTSIPVSKVEFQGSNFPLYRGSFGRSLARTGEALGGLFSATPKTIAGNVDKRFHTGKTYNSASGKAKAFGNVSLTLIALDGAASIHQAYTDAKDFFEINRQQGFIRQSWDDVETAIDEGIIGEEFYNVDNLSQITNYIYQGKDNFGNNESLRETAKNVSKNISKNYKDND